MPLWATVVAASASGIGIELLFSHNIISLAWILAMFGVGREVKT